jgi:hypothetical protein
LVDGDGGSSIMANLKVQQPTEFAQVRDVKELADILLEFPDRIGSIRGNGHIVCSDSDIGLFGCC